MKRLGVLAIALLGCQELGPEDVRKGQCLGWRTDRDGCPPGYVRRGYYDAGRSAGRGIGWCEKL